MLRNHVRLLLAQATLVSPGFIRWKFEPLGYQTVGEVRKSLRHLATALTVFHGLFFPLRHLLGKPLPSIQS